jgi:hypothetical protein
MCGTLRKRAFGAGRHDFISSKLGREPASSAMKIAIRLSAILEEAPLAVRPS